MDNINRHLEIARPFFNGASMVLFPELSTVGDPDSVTMKSLAETFEGRTCDIFLRTAREHNTWFGFGLPRTNQDDRIHYSYVIATSSGDLLFCNQANDLESAGPGYLSFTHHGVELGLTICRDASTPSTQKKIMAKTPELVLIPMMAGAGDIYKYSSIIWRTNILSVNYAGQVHGLSSIHHYDGTNKIGGQSLKTDEGALIVTL